MQKQTGTSSGKNNKSCGVFHHEPNKIGFAFFPFSQIFYAIYKYQQKHFYYLSYPFAVRPSERNFSLQCSSWGHGRRGSGQIPAGAGGGASRGMARGGAGGG
jgi:hypothetical protein